MPWFLSQSIPISPHQANHCGESTHSFCSSSWRIPQTFIGKPDFSRAFSDPFLEAAIRSRELALCWALRLLSLAGLLSSASLLVHGSAGFDTWVRENKNDTGLFLVRDSPVFSHFAQPLFYSGTLPSVWTGPPNCYQKYTMGKRVRLVAKTVLCLLFWINLSVTTCKAMPLSGDYHYFSGRLWGCLTSINAFQRWWRCTNKIGAKCEKNKRFSNWGLRFQLGDFVIENKKPICQKQRLICPHL